MAPVAASVERGNVSIRNVGPLALRSASMPRLFFALVLAGCAPSFTISLAHDRQDERATRTQLERVLSAHDVSRFTYTRTIAIDDEAIPYSHPVLTLHARHLDDDDLLLSTFVHEQAHWWLEARSVETDAAVSDLRALFPTVPVGFPDGAQSERSSYEHLIVDHLEHVALGCLLPEERVARAFTFWEGDHYRGLYAIEREHGDAIEAIAARHGLAYRCE
jgi:hypothetical protein